MDFSAVGIEGLSTMLARRRMSVGEVVDVCLAEIRRQSELNAFITVAADEARARAKVLDALPSRRRGPLHGIPYAAKDVIATRGIRTTNGSRVTGDWTPDVDAAVVNRLHTAGAVLVGKLNLWEFAMSGTSPAGEVLNPWSSDHSPGGSSSGSGAAVAAGLVPFALGTDTGGSIRVPAAWCGVTGLRPTYGRVPRAGVTVNAWTIDTVGPLAARADDVATVFAAIADAGPPVTVGRLQGVRVGVPRRYFFDDMHHAVGTAMTAALLEIERLGADLVEVDVPHAAEGAIVRTIHMAEAAQYHERRLRVRGHLFGPELHARLEEARLYLATDYIKALRIRTLLQREVSAVFDRCDAFVTPTDVNPPPPVRPSGGANRDRPARNAGNTFLASLTGIPALALPIGFTSGQPALPISMLLHGRPFEERLAFQLASAFQRVTDWHLKRPRGVAAGPHADRGGV